MFFAKKSFQSNIYKAIYLYWFFVFMFSLSKVVNKVVKLIFTLYAEMRSASCLGKSVIRVAPIILSNSSLADSYVACA